jgi:PAS domain S-box-containing protein
VIRTEKPIHDFYFPDRGEQFAMNEKTIYANLGHIIACDQWLQILDELNIGAFTVDLQRKVSAMNLNAQVLIGLKDTEAIGKDCREVFVGVPCLANCPFKRAGAPTTEEPIIMLHGDDESLHLVTRMAAPVYDSDRQQVGCLTILQDHSPIADLIDRIHYEERSMKLILDNLDVGIFTVNRGGHITFFNKEAEKITGYSRREVLGKSCAYILEGAGSQEMCLLEDSIADGTSRSSRDGRMTTRDGITIPIRANHLALRNEKGAVIGGLTTFHDLTLVHQLNQAIQDRYTFYDMIGKSPVMQKVFDMVKVVAVTDATILIEGSTGTGKDLLAKIVHSISRRARKPLVKVNCAAIPETLLESEMFGYLKGAFTGAIKDKIGRFQEAEGGTIFLDEIGDLPLSLQAKMLRVLEDREFYRLGSHHTQKVDVRIISATNRDLNQLVQQRLFREDLFYRLNVFRIELPPLKERRDDIPLLIEHILRRMCAARGIATPEVSRNVMEILLNYEYPGNARELENILEHALIICREDMLHTRHLPEYLLDRRQVIPPQTSAERTPASTFESREREALLAMLRQHGWRRISTARALGIDRTTLWRKMKKYHLLP